MGRRVPLKKKKEKEFEVGDWVWMLKQTEQGVLRPVGGEVFQIVEKISKSYICYYRLNSKNKGDWTIAKYLMKARGVKYGQKK